MTALYIVTVKIRIKLIPESYYNMLLPNSRLLAQASSQGTASFKILTSIITLKLANLNIYKYKYTSNAPVIFP